jgi:hypothetical protein
MKEHPHSVAAVIKTGPGHRVQDARATIPAENIRPTSDETGLVGHHTQCRARNPDTYTQLFTVATAMR